MSKTERQNTGSAVMHRTYEFFNGHRYVRPGNYRNGPISIGVTVRRNLLDGDVAIDLQSQEARVNGLRAALTFSTTDQRTFHGIYFELRGKSKKGKDLLAHVDWDGEKGYGPITVFKGKKEVKKAPKKLRVLRRLGVKV